MRSIKSPGLWAYVMLDSRFSFLRRVRDLTRIHKLVKVSEKQQAVRIQVSFEQASSSSPRKHGKNVMCYRCGEKGHLAEIRRKEATRFVCGAFGHRSFYCPRRGKQGNQVILFLVLQPYEDMMRNVEHLRKCAVSLRGRASLSKASF